MANVFTYGSLMFDAVWRQVVVGDYRSESARLDGYRRLALKGEDFPGLVQASDIDSASVAGLVYRDVSADDLDRLDRFEGELYYRQSITVGIGTASLVADTYVFRPEFYRLLADWEWDVEYFKQTGLQRFLQGYSGYEYI